MPDGSVPAVRETLIRLDGVAKDYDTGGGVVRALRDVDLRIEQGEFVAVVGTSGSGKSTLMNILGCLDRPTRGSYMLADVEVGARSNDGRAIVRNRLVGFVFQGFNLLPRTTALENCELPLQYRGVGARERRKRAEAALAAVGLQDRMDHTPNMLSGGQQQRVAIARALVTDPPLLLADEPTGNLDTRTSLEVLALLQRLNRERGITVVLVTHEHDIAACAGRVITFRDGRVVSDDRQAAPLDAARALEELPPPQAYEPPKEDGAAIATRARTKIPFAVYLGMLGGTVLGNLLGYLYDTFVVGQSIAGVPAVVGLLLEAGLASWVFGKKVGRRMSVDERARVAVYYSIAQLAVAAGIFAWLGVAKVPSSVLSRFEGHGSASVVVMLGLLVALSLARFLLLSLRSLSWPKKR